MNDAFKKMIAEAAAQANQDITAVQKGEFDPIVRVIVAGEGRKTGRPRGGHSKDICTVCGSRQ
jgi:hypothetical protein